MSRGLASLVAILAVTSALSQGSRAASDTDNKPFGVDPFDVVYRKGLLTVRKPIPDYAEVPSKRIRTIETEEQADSDLFEANRFPEVSDILLSSDNNPTHLRCVARNYPGIADLIVIGTSGIDDLTILSKFHSLKLLQLEDKVESQARNQAVESFPKSIETLILRKTQLLDSPRQARLAFPRLKELRLQDESIQPQFFESLESPWLKEVWFSDCFLAKGTFAALSKFKSLRVVNCRDTKLDPGEVEKLKHASPKVEVGLD